MIETHDHSGSPNGSEPPEPAAESVPVATSPLVPAAPSDPASPSGTASPSDARSPSDTAPDPDTAPNPDAAPDPDTAPDPEDASDPASDPEAAPNPEDASGPSARGGEAETSESATSGPEAPGSQLVRVNDPAEALPVLARATATAWLRAAAWGLGTSLRVGAHLARAATDPNVAVDLYGELSDGVRNYAREFLGITEIEQHVGRGLLAPTTREPGRDPDRALRARGEALLRAAADVGVDLDVHPAYARILSEIASDEARILRLLATSGPQALVDIRAGNLIGIGSQLVAQSMNMIDAQAGLRQRDRVALYLANLSRLGLISLSDDDLEDPLAYQLLEAQPDVLSVLKETPRAKTVRRSVTLTALGQDFYDVCFPQAPLELPPAGGSGVLDA